MRFVHPIARAAALGMAALFASISPTWANLVTNPGFEECLDVGQTPPPGWTGTASCGGRPGGGADPDMGFFSAIFDASVTLSQSFATSAGDKYEFSFWLFNTNPIAIPHAFTAAFGPDMVLNLGSNVDTFPYTFYDFTVSATAASSTISFASSGPTGAVWYLDDVSVTPVLTVAAPEPATLSLFAGALSLFLLTRLMYWRRTQPSRRRSTVAKTTCNRAAAREERMTA